MPEERGRTKEGENGTWAYYCRLYRSAREKRSKAATGRGDQLLHRLGKEEKKSISTQRKALETDNLLSSMRKKPRSHEYFTAGGSKSEK